MENDEMMCLYFRVFFYQRFVSLKQFQLIYFLQIALHIKGMLKSSFVFFSPLIGIQHFSFGGRLLLLYSYIESAVTDGTLILIQQFLLRFLPLSSQNGRRFIDLCEKIS